MMVFEAGERFTLKQEDSFLLLTKGKVEVYAVTSARVFSPSGPRISP